MLDTSDSIIDENKELVVAFMVTNNPENKVIDYTTATRETFEIYYRGRAKNTDVIPTDMVSMYGIFKETIVPGRSTFILKKGSFKPFSLSSFSFKKRNKKEDDTYQDINKNKYKYRFRCWIDDPFGLLPGSIGGLLSEFNPDYILLLTNKNRLLKITYDQSIKWRAEFHHLIDTHLDLYLSAKESDEYVIEPKIEVLSENFTNTFIFEESISLRSIDFVN